MISKEPGLDGSLQGLCAITLPPSGEHETKLGR